MADGNAPFSGGKSPDSLIERRGPLRPPQLSSVRRRKAPASIVHGIQLFDFLAFAGGAAACGWLSGSGALTPGLALAPILAMAAMLLLRAYDFCVSEPMWRHHLRAGGAILAVGIAATAANMVLAPGRVTNREPLIWVLLAGTLTFASHAAWGFKIARWRASGRLLPNVVLVGCTPTAEELIRSALQTKNMCILGIFDDRRERVGPDLLGVPVLGTTQDILNHKILPYVDRVVLSLPLEATGRISEMLDRLAPIPNHVALIASGSAQGPSITRFADVPLTTLAGDPSRSGNPTAKRAFDLVISAAALLLLAPILVLIAVAVRWDSRGPAIFKQHRHGYLNETVVVWKFRSMRVDAEDPTASRQVTADDDRVTRVGRFLRRTSLDELPQLFNVLRGEMSLVGPRPHAIGMKAAGQDAAGLAVGYAHRHRIKPGLTGWAAINGSRGPADTPEAIQRRIALDLEYVERQSFWFDLRIIVLTIPCLFGDDTVVR